MSGWTRTDCIWADVLVLDSLWVLIADNNRIIIIIIVIIKMSVLIC